MSDKKMRRLCPDGGRCHHECERAGPCFRVECCLPLSGVYSGDVWPSSVVDEHDRLADAVKEAEQKPVALSLIADVAPPPTEWVNEVVEYKPIELPSFLSSEAKPVVLNTLEEYTRLLGPFLFRDVVVSELRRHADAEQVNAHEAGQRENEYSSLSCAAHLGAAQQLRLIADGFEAATNIVDQADRAVGIGHLPREQIIPSMLVGCCKEHRLKAEGCKVCEPTFAAIKEVAFMLQERAEARALIIAAKDLIEDAGVRDDCAPRKLAEGGYGEVYEDRRALLSLVRRLRHYL